jgi:hypothetical protein
MATEDDLRAIALSLPGVEERPSYGRRPSWRVGGHGFAGIWRDEASAVLEAEDRAEKEALVAAEPGKFAATAHHGESSRILVRLAAVTPEELRPLVVESWRHHAPPDLVARLDDGGGGGDAPAG